MVGTPPGMPRSNAIPDEREVAIHSLRPIERELALDGQGFSVVPHKSAVADFYDEAELLRVYYPESAELVRAATGAARVTVFDHTIRRSSWQGQDRVPGVARAHAIRPRRDPDARCGLQRVP